MALPLRALASGAQSLKSKRLSRVSALTAVLLAVSLLPGCTNPAGGLDPGAAVNAFLDTARILEGIQNTSDVGSGQARILQGKARLGLLEATIAGLTDSPAKRDLKSAAAALRSALNGSAYLLDSFQAMKANRTNETLANLDAARANFTEAQRFAGQVADPELRGAMDFGPVAAEIERMVGGLKGAK